MHRRFTAEKSALICRKVFRINESAILHPMCGITGVFAFNLVGKFSKINIAAATLALSHRGPDYQDIHLDEWICLGHRRLSIIDTSNIAHQPLWDETNRYAIIFNGEIFNYRELREELKLKGFTFFSESDTEVLLKMFIHEKEKCLNKLNGFFAFCIYDRQEQSLFLARDRYGIKPLLYVMDEDKFLFGSEMKSILAYGVNKDIDYSSLFTYLQLNYVTAPNTIFSNVKKLMPGHFVKVINQQMVIEKYYEIPYDPQKISSSISYDSAKEKFKTLLESSVQRRLVSDVPLGSFLSGGIDSSVIAALATRHKPDIHTFSIGFKDEKFFDETAYAELVAKHIKSNHTVFSLTNNDLFKHVTSILDYIDEPFADSSAIAVYILSQETRKHATVALSGDGADELLGGYNKHSAFYRALNPGIKESAASLLSPLWNILPKSRHTPFSNKVRQLNRFAEGANLSSKERYWRWASFTKESVATKLLSQESQSKLVQQEYELRKQELLKTLPGSGSMNDILLTDVNIILANDMLTKVDLMSMANGLEVRVPFLDYEVVNFLFSLTADYKIDGKMKKKILQDTFRDILPAELYNRPKKGFEIPLLKWLRNEMRSLINDDLLSEKFILEQGIFEYREIKKLKQKLFSFNPGDVHARIWGLVVFQWWWKKMF